MGRLQTDSNQVVVVGWIYDLNGTMTLLVEKPGFTSNENTTHKPKGPCFMSRSVLKSCRGDGKLA